VLHGEADGVGPAAGSEGHARHFTASYERRVIPVAGHFLSREAPEASSLPSENWAGHEHPC